MLARGKSKKSKLLLRLGTPNVLNISSSMTLLQEDGYVLRSAIPAFKLFPDNLGALLRYAQGAHVKLLFLM